MSRIDLAHFFAKLGVLASAIVATIVALSWIFHVDIFLTLLPGLASMKLNTALLFVLISGYISFSVNNTYVRAQNIVLATIFLISTTTFLSYVLSFDNPLDQLFVADPFTAPDEFPGRMSWGTATVFVLFAIDFLIEKRSPKVAEWMMIFIHFLSVLLVLAFIFDVNSLYNLPFFSTVAIHTTLLFATLSLSLLTLRREGFVRKILTDESPVGIAIRNLLPLALILPVTLSWFVLQGYWNNWYSLSFGIILLTVLIVAIETLLVVLYARTLQKWYRREQTLQKQVLESEMSRIEMEKEREITQSKEQFLAMFSHDMKTPLATIMLSSDILITYDERLDVEKRLHHLKKIRFKAYEVLDGVDDIIHLTRMQMDELPFAPNRGDIVAFCRNYFTEFIELRDQSHHQFTSDIPAVSVNLDFDPALLRRALGNLLGNAVKYSPDGGQIAFKVVDRYHCVDIEISDQGIGIPPESIESLFDVFARASNVGSIGGHGLGLAIVKLVTQAHSGTVRVESTLGKGTTFILSLPYQAQDVASDQSG